MLQTAVNFGILLATVAAYFMAGLPQPLRVPGRHPAGAGRALDSPRRARARGMARGQAAGQPTPSRACGDLFRGAVRRITVLTILVCSLSLTAHWAFMFW